MLEGKGRLRSTLPTQRKPRLRQPCESVIAAGFQNIVEGSSPTDPAPAKKVAASKAAKAAPAAGKAAPAAAKAADGHSRNCSG